MNTDIHDTREAAIRAATSRSRGALAPRMRGEWAELRVFLEDALGIPAHARSFTVTFSDGASPIVTVAYTPREPEDTAP